MQKWIGGCPFAGWKTKLKIDDANKFIYVCWNRQEICSYKDRDPWKIGVSRSTRLVEWTDMTSDHGFRSLETEEDYFFVLAIEWYDIIHATKLRTNLIWMNIKGFQRMIGWQANNIGMPLSQFEYVHIHICIHMYMHAYIHTNIHTCIKHTHSCLHLFCDYMVRYFPHQKFQNSIQCLAQNFNSQPLPLRQNDIWIYRFPYMAVVAVISF